MLVQHRHDALRLIAQHDHALLSGELASAWVGAAGEEVLPLALILAAALHDVSWRELDTVPLWDPDRSLPHDFTTYPRELRTDATAAGIRKVATLHPYAGRLVALHYRRLGIETPDIPEAVSDEADPDVRRDVEFLRLFDNLSLFLGLTPPGTGPEGHYSWLMAGERFELPDGSGRLHLSWESETELAVAPFHFRHSPLELEVPYREIPRARLTSDAMERAWGSADVDTMTLRLIRGGRTAG